MGREALAKARRDAGFSTQESLAEHLGVAVSTVARLEQAVTKEPQDPARYAKALKISQKRLDDLLDGDDHDDGSDWTHVEPPDADDIEAIELIRRIEASDTGPATIDGLEDATDRLCRSYTSTPPADLLEPLRAYRGYVMKLLDGRATLAQRRHLMALGGWLSLLAAICHIDLHQYRAAGANLDAARRMGSETGNDQLSAWAMETEAWQALTDGHHRRAVDLSAAAREHVPVGSSAHVQLTVQQARASARLGLVRETHQLLDDAAVSLDRMPTPEHPEHHFQFDPRKLVGYTATTLAWLGDDPTIAEDYARQAIAQYDVRAIDGRWARRLALARIDLALVLIGADQPTEAVHLAALALDSGRMVPSNLWRLDELDQRFAARYGHTDGIDDLHDRYVETHRHLTGRPPLRALGL